ncbi:hypothetical protein GCM10020358_13840 [Amorphoplanes nipponensis]|uniref:UspA domain-containing protein n=1 Tax=Actinoplanes nipponensis TaxID=135950 RepID=A0A919JRI0_9ACTN|nr:universal stress protein [Actinoplanes nipponensis]GIE54115.1 hypothetical protein Ani05nite_76490 [Actinoplanes nipponensis]
MHVAARAACSVLIARAGHPPGRCVVVGVNGSSASERALDFAFDTAARSGAGLVVVRAGGGGGDDQRRHLADLVGVREDKYRIRARTRVLPHDPAAALVAESAQAGLLIVGARGRQRYGGLLGSVAQTLLHHSSAPLVLVRTLVTAPVDPAEQSPAAASAP